MKFKNKYLTSIALNNIISINILVYLFGVILSLISRDIYFYFVVLSSLSSNIIFDLNYLHVFITHGFFHMDLFHVFSNMLVLTLLYPLISKNDNNDIWIVYLSSVLFSGLICLFITYLVGFKFLYLLGASGGIMGLISYSCFKYYNEYLFNNFFKIKFKHILWGFIFLILMGMSSGINFYGEVCHMIGIIIGYIYYKIKNKSS